MREKKLLINSVLYFFGSLGKGIASIIVVFLGSFYISPADMGVYDLIVSSITLLQPIIIFQINDGIYRWLLENPEDKDSIIACGFKIAYRNLILTNIVLFVLLQFINIDNIFWAIILLNVNCIYPLLQQITRGLKNHKVFALSGIINGSLIMIISYILMRFYNCGVSSFYLGQIIANAVSIIYLSIVQHINLLNLTGDRKRIKEYSGPMQKYSIMLVPNSVNQWVMKALDKYCILFFLTTFDNGIYTIAHRFPEVLIMINNMFYSAWTEQSIVEYHSKDRDAYFSKIYNLYIRAITGVVLVAIPATKYLVWSFAGPEYHDAYKYIPFLYVGVIFLGLSSFIGTGYLGTKHTEGIMYTSLAGSVLNVIINIVLMPYFGLQIAGISSLCAYFLMWVIRTYQTRKFFDITVEWKVFVPMVGLTLLFALFVQLNNWYIDIVIELMAIIVAVIANRRLLQSLIETGYQKLRRR